MIAVGAFGRCWSPCRFKTLGGLLHLVRRLRSPVPCRLDKWMRSCYSLSVFAAVFKDYVMADIWFVRAGKESVYAEDFLQRNIVAIGWPELGALDPSIAKPKLIQLYQQTFASHSDGRVQVAVSQIIRFMYEVKVGDAVMTHDRDKQLYYIG